MTPTFRKLGKKYSRREIKYVYFLFVLQGCVDCGGKRSFQKPEPADNLKKTTRWNIFRRGTSWKLRIRVKIKTQVESVIFRFYFKTIILRPDFVSYSEFSRRPFRNMFYLVCSRVSLSFYVRYFASDSYKPRVRSSSSSWLPYDA